MEYCSAIKKNEIMPFAATQIDLGTGILSEVSQTEKERCCMTFLTRGSKRNYTEELTYKTERDSQMQRTDLWLLGGGDAEGKGQLGSLGWTYKHCYI